MNGIFVAKGCFFGGYCDLDVVKVYSQEGFIHLKSVLVSLHSKRDCAGMCCVFSVLTVFHCIIRLL